MGLEVYGISHRPHSQLQRALSALARSPSAGASVSIQVDSPDGMPGSERLGEVNFCGVVFYEDEIDTRNPYVRCHGPGSVYTRLLPDLRVWFKTQ